VRHAWSQTPRFWFGSLTSQSTASSSELTVIRNPRDSISTGCFQHLLSMISTSDERLLILKNRFAERSFHL
jgi:hypothetical protein